jgi:hypothetical protein
MTMTCFVVMPIGLGERYPIFRDRFELLIKPAVEFDENGNPTHITCIRSDDINESGSITKKFLEQLYHANIVIVDLSELNHNVFYEFGVRHGLRNGTIAIASEGTELPFDVKDYRVVFYKDKIGGDKAFVPKLRGHVQSLVKDPDHIDSPVVQYIPELKERFDLDATHAKGEILRLSRELEASRAKVAVLEDTNLDNREKLTRLSDSIENLLLRFTLEDRRQAEQQIASAGEQGNAESKRDKQREMFKGNAEMVFLALSNSAASSDVYNAAVAAATPHHMNVIKATEEVAGGLVIDHVYDKVLMAGLMIADLTSRDANVLFEVGIAHALGKEVILVTQDLQHVPFDVRNQRTLVYRDFPELRERLRRFLEDFQLRHRISQGG